MAHYTFIDLSLANNILSLYGLEGASSLTPFGQGISNTNYLVRRQGPSGSLESLVLKVSNDKTLDQLNQELALVSYLQQQHYSKVVTPLSTLKGALSYQWENYWGALFPYVPHDQPNSVRNSAPTPAKCFQVGSALGELHQKTASHQRNVHLRSIEQVSYLPRQLRAFLTDPQCPVDFAASLQQRLQLHQQFLPLTAKLGLPTQQCHWEKLEQAFEHQPHALLHGDLYFDNCLFQGDQLACLLDFEQSGYGPPLFDLGVCLSDCALDPQGTPNMNCFRELLRGYEQQCHLLSSEMKANILMSVIVGLYSIARWRIQRFTIGQLDPTRRESYRTLTNKADHFLHCMVQGISL